MNFYNRIIFILDIMFQLTQTQEVILLKFVVKRKPNIF